jgi:nucleotide-binding universal stress UspA family protein
MMLPFKKVLCATDFSAPSCEAVVAASEIATVFSARLFLVHVVRPLPPVVAATPGCPIYTGESEGNSLEHARQRLRESARRLVGRDVATVVRVVPGSVAAQILNVAKSEDVDLIVISTHGTTGLRRILGGSVAERVARMATCPVLTVHSGQLRTPKKRT